MSAVEGAANKADIKQVSARNITSPQVLGVIAAVGGLFVLLAACRVLPSGVNGISQLGVGGKVLGAAVIAGGTTAVMCCRNLHATTTPVATEAQHVSQLLYGFCQLEGKCMSFGLINGKLVPIEGSGQNSEGFVLSKHSAAEVLFACTKSNCVSSKGQGNPIKYILEHPNNGGLITKKEFASYLLEDNRLFELDGEDLVAALSLIDSLDKDTASRLLVQFSSCDNVVLAIANKASKVITEGHVLNALSCGKLEVAKTLKECITPSESCKQLFMIAEGNDSITIQEDLLEGAYCIAHIYENDGIVERLAPRMPTTEVPTGLNALERDFPPTFNRLQMREQARNYLKGLRNQGLLLTKEEFDQKVERDRSAGILYSKQDGENIGCLLGKSFLEETVQALNLETIKVPKKFAVIKEGNQVNFSVSYSDMFSFRGEPLSGTIEIYSETISSLGRRLQQSEMEELARLMLATGFQGHRLSFRPSYDGIYCIDTSCQSFDPAKISEQIWNQIGGLNQRHNPDDDSKWVREMFSRRREERLGEVENNRALEEEKRKLFRDQVRLHGYEVQGPEFNFSLEELG